MENNLIRIPWKTVRLIAVLVVLACGLGIAAILLLVPQATATQRAAPIPEGAAGSADPDGATDPTAPQVEQAAPHAVPTSTQDAAVFDSPLMTEPTREREPTHTPPPTATPSPSATETPTDAPPTATPTITNTPTPTQTPTITHTPAPTYTPAPTATPTPPPPLTMEWVLVRSECISAAEWFGEFWLTAQGGTGEYTFYHDIKVVHGPARDAGFGYHMYAGTGSAVVGTFAVESGTQRVEQEFWLARPDCRHLEAPPPPDPVTPPPP